MRAPAAGLGGERGRKRESLWDEVPDATVAMHALDPWPGVYQLIAQNLTTHPAPSLGLAGYESLLHWLNGRLIVHHLLQLKCNTRTHPKPPAPSHLDKVGQGAVRVAKVEDLQCAPRWMSQPQAR